MIRPFRGVHPQIHPTAFIADSAQVIGDVHIGEESSVWFGSVLRGDMFYIRIGERANVQDNCVLHTRTGQLPTILEDEVTVGHSVTLHGCYVEHGSLIGIGSIVLDDVRVGAQSLVAAGSLVTPGTIIPPRSLVMGSPAKVKRPLTGVEVDSLQLYWLNYVEYAKYYVIGPAASSWVFKLPPGGVSFEEVERDLIIQAMKQTDYKITKAAKLLGLTFRTLQYRLEKFGIKRPDGSSIS